MSQWSTAQHCHTDTPVYTIRKSHVTWNFAVPVHHSEEIRRRILLFLCTLDVIDESGNQTGRLTVHCTFISKSNSSAILVTAHVLCAHQQGLDCVYYRCCYKLGTKLILKCVFVIRMYLDFCIALISLFCFVFVIVVVFFGTLPILFLSFFLLFFSTTPLSFSDQFFYLFCFSFSGYFHDSKQTAANVQRPGKMARRFCRFSESVRGKKPRTEGNGHFTFAGELSYIWNV